MYFNEPVGRGKTPGEENPKILSEKKKKKNVSPEPVRCCLPLSKVFQRICNHKMRIRLITVYVHAAEKIIGMYSERNLFLILKRLKSANENL